jgi:hypothetical protein
MRLQPEGGVTQISLENARTLIEAYGLPQIVQLVNAGKDASEHEVVATWEDEAEFTFTGFAWGYGGEGPRGLAEFFRMVGLDKRVPTQAISRLPQDQEGTVLSFSRDGWSIEFAYEGAGEIHESLENVEGPFNTP